MRLSCNSLNQDTTSSLAPIQASLKSASAFSLPIEDSLSGRRNVNGKRYADDAAWSVSGYQSACWQDWQVIGKPKQASKNNNFASYFVFEQQTCGYGVHQKAMQA